MADREIRRLVEEGELERVEPDRELAEQELSDAITHLQSAEKLVDEDPLLAYTALYDATRKALAAHMRARGLRVRGKVGYHAKTMRYGAAGLAHLGLDEELERLDEMRIIRNDAEYEGRRIGRQEVAADLETARRVIEAARADL
jgi:hypothetical protein